MANAINKIDLAFQRLLTSRHPLLRRADRLFQRAFGPLPPTGYRLPATGPSAPLPLCPSNLFMSSFDDILGGENQQITVGRGVRGEKGIYQVLSEFAQGGMATIYLIRDQAGNEQLLKAIADFSAFPKETQVEARLRFANEVQVMEGVNSPHVVKLTDRDPQPLPRFYIMERIKGRDLRKAVPDNKTLDPHLALSIMIRVLDGLLAVESASVKVARSDPRFRTFQFAHRDLKPENILIGLEGNRVNRIVLSDFGIVKLPGSELTQLGMLLGTPGYIDCSREIFFNAKAADQRSDIFALGAILYWLFTGREAFDAEASDYFTSFPDNAPRLIERLKADRPIEISPQMWAATFKALAADPAKRFQNYTDLRAILAAIHQMGR